MTSMESTPRPVVTISEAISRYLSTIQRAKSKHTFLSYKTSLQIFSDFLSDSSLDPAATPIENLTESEFAHFIETLTRFSPATEQLYLQAVKGFYLFASSEKLLDVNQSSLVVLIRQRSRRPGKRLPQFPEDSMRNLLDKVQDITNLLVPTGPGEDVSNIKLRAYRDRAFLITLADTGFRVHEACNLRRGDIDWNEQRAIIIGKGDKEAVVRFTSNSLHAIKEYLTHRAELDGSSGKQLSSLPVFARHDKGAGKRVKPMTTTTGRNIVNERVEQFLGKEMVGRITPHSFRHYFVTSVLRGTGNLNMAQRMARHKNISVTERYTHLTDDELDKAYHDVFEKDNQSDADN